MYNKVVGNMVMILGDLHISDVFKGKHKDYLQNCMWVLKEITKKIEETKPSAVVLGGDLIGWTETNIRDRQILSTFCKYLREWNDICPVYSVRGNHDIKGYPDFMFLSELGLIITSTKCGGYFDYYGEENAEKPEVRFHLVDYNDEHKSLDILDGTSNIVLGHNNYTIQGVTNWYAEHDGIELGMLQNFGDVDMVISGHIHNPSPDFVSTQMPSGKDCMLFYTGCPTRPIKEKNMYDYCWYVFVRYDKDLKDTNIDTEMFKLLPASEIFYDDAEFVEEKDKDELEETMRVEALQNVLGELMTFRITTGDPMEQIDNIPNASEEAKKLAKNYLQIAYNKTR